MNNLTVVLIILGIVQGVAEFLPISSSGHLVILEQVSFFKNELNRAGNEINLFINVALHLATLLAIIAYLRRDIAIIAKGFVSGIIRKNLQNAEIKIILNIIAASIPAGVIGILFRNMLEKIFISTAPVFIFLIINGLILILTKKITVRDRNIEQVGLVRSILIGFFQAFAILPGISRSGMTITGGMFMGLKPVESAKFSFLIAIPVIAGAGVIEGIRAARGNFPMDLLFPLLIAMLITTAVALISLKILFVLVKRIKIDIFGYYTILLGIGGFIVLFFIS